MMGSRASLRFWFICLFYFCSRKFACFLLCAALLHSMWKCKKTGDRFKGVGVHVDSIKYICTFTFGWCLQCGRVPTCEKNNSDYKQCRDIPLKNKKKLNYTLRRKVQRNSGKFIGKRFNFFYVAFFTFLAIIRREII